MVYLCACLGFTTQQAEIIASALVKIMEANVDIVYKDMVTKVQQVGLALGFHLTRAPGLSCGGKYSLRMWF